jgi:DNA-binding NtrC family response regulator
MVEGRTETTPREESCVDAAATHLALRLVSPVASTHALRLPRIELGRVTEAGICLDHSGVSRRHAELFRQGPLYVLQDLGSTNGTWLNGRRIERGPISPGDVIRVGECVGIFDLQTETDAAFGEIAPGLLGGAQMARMFAPAERAANSQVPILVVGDTGAGKERVARAIHARSGRTGPFFAVNCAALPEPLAEAELFGHRRGAFTGADKQGLGYFRAADGGTLFLDEMPELSGPLQAKLLRVVEDGRVLALGEVTSTQVDVRVVAASQSPLGELVAKKKLRRDLAARLNGLTLLIPPLAARRADVVPLFERFLHQQTGGHPPPVDARLLEALLLHRWPENVRELELLTRTLLAVHGNEAILRRQHLPDHFSPPSDAVPPAALPAPNDTSYEARLEGTLKGNGGNVRAAAAALGISRQRIYRYLASRDNNVDVASLRVDSKFDVPRDR